MRIATCWSIGSGPAGLMAALRRRAPAPASSSPTRTSRLGGSLLGETRRDRRRQRLRRGLAAVAGRARGAAQCPHHAAAPPSSASTTAIPSARSSGSTIICRCRRPIEPRQRYWRIIARRGGARGRRRSSGRWCSAAMTGPASCWLGGADLCQPLCGRAGHAAPWSSPTTTMAGARPRDLLAAGIAGRRGRRCARDGGPAASPAAPKCRRRHADGVGHARRRRPGRIAASTSSLPSGERRRRIEATCSRCPAAGTRRSHLTCHLGGKPVWDDAHRRLRAAGDRRRA